MKDTSSGHRRERRPRAELCDGQDPDAGSAVAQTAMPPLARLTSLMSALFVEGRRLISCLRIVVNKDLF